MNGSKVVCDAAVIGDRRTVAAIRRDGVSAATPALEKHISIPSCRYGVRAGRPAPQLKPYGCSSDLVVTASDQRMDAAAAAAVTMAVTMRGWAVAPHHLHHWVRFRRRKRIGADRWQSGRRGHTDRANEDRSKNVTHLVTPFVPIGPWP